nr:MULTISPECIES: hypothetical protein [Bradyrhizobium]
MSGIVLSASVRQNLLSLQSTADLLATTQSRLSTGKSVNSALDNPTNFFTAQSLDNRASDINNLLDGIANGVPHCLTQNVTGQLLADDWVGAIELVRWRLWRERSVWARGARWCRR